MTETQKPETQNPKEGDGKQDCGIHAAYGFSIAIVGLSISFVIAIIMLGLGMRTASDLVAVIGAFTTVTGTLTGYFFGEKMGSSNKEKTEIKLSASVDSLISEKTKSATVAENLQKSESDNKVIRIYLKNNQDVIKRVDQKLNPSQTMRGFKGEVEAPSKNAVNEVLYSLNEAKIPDEVLRSLHVYDD